MLVSSGIEIEFLWYSQHTHRYQHPAVGRTLILMASPLIEFQTCVEFYKFIKEEEKFKIEKLFW